MAGVARAAITSFLLHDFGYHPELSGWNHPRVDSPFWRLYYNPVAGSRIDVGSEAIALKPDRCVLIPAGTIFDCVQESERVKHLWLHFTVTQPEPPDVAGPVQVRITHPMRAVLDEAIVEHAKPASGDRDRALQALGSALVHLCLPHIEVPEPSPVPEWLMPVLEHVRRFPNEDLRNSTLAKISGKSLEHFIRGFSTHMKRTPAAYVSETRVRLAAERLALEDDSIEQIAKATGFPNRHYFSRVFAKQMGCGPAEFRRRQRERGQA